MSNHYETGESFFDSIHPERKLRRDLLDEFWAKQTFKIFVCTLKDSRARPRIKPETRYVRVNEWKLTDEVKQRARIAAWKESVDFARIKQVRVGVRLADPELDLGCKWGGDEPNPLGGNNE